MKTVDVTLKSTSPYSQSRAHNVPKESKESADDHERRTWRNRLHVDAEGRVFIPPMALKGCLAEAAKFTGKQIPGRGKSTYTKHFEAGILVQDGPVLHGTDGKPILAEAVDGKWFFLNADGVRGSGKRVWKCQPDIPEWTATARFYVIDDTITEAVFEETLAEAGNFIGIGRFRPRNGGYYGRFQPTEIAWLDAETAQAAE